ncbi:MAG: DUF3606 domain-containing protein [Caldimonas sp.]
MTDPIDLRVVPDRSRIDLDQQDQRRYWSGRLGVTEEVLRRAVTRVGAQPDKVHEYLRGPNG